MLFPETAVSGKSPPAESVSAAGHTHSLSDSLLLACLIAAGAVLRFLFLTRKSFWFDEGVSVQIARLDWYNFARILWRREANMSLYYLLLRGWLHMGHSECFIRSLSVLAALAAIPAIYWLGRRLFDCRVGLIAATLLTVNAYHIRYAQEARSYSLFVFMAIMSCGYFVRSIQTPSRNNRIGHIVTSSVSVYVHFFAGLLIVAQWLSLRFLDPELVPSPLQKRWASQWRWIAGLSFPALLFAAATGVGPLSWIKRPGFKVLYDYYNHMAGNGGFFLLLAYFAACAAALAPVAREIFRRAAPWQIWRYQFLLLWLLAPISITITVSLARPMFVPRYFVFCLPAYILLASAGIARIRLTAFLLVIMVFFAGLALKGVLSYYDHDFDLEREDWRAASNYVLQNAASGDAILFHIAMGRMPFSFYQSLYPGGTHGAAIIYPGRADRIDYHDFLGKPEKNLLLSVPAKCDRVWVVLEHNKNKAGEPDFTTLLVSQIFGMNYLHRQDRFFPGIEVRLYADRSGLFRPQSGPEHP
jgi:mannosyltransferase